LYLYLECDKITHSNKTQIPSPNLNNQDLLYIPAWNLEVGLAAAG
jgi:hypothetical protein